MIYKLSAKNMVEVNQFIKELNDGHKTFELISIMGIDGEYIINYSLNKPKASFVHIANKELSK